MINSSFTTAIYYTIAIVNFSVEGVGIAIAIAKKRPQPIPDPSSGNRSLSRVINRRFERTLRPVCFN